MYPTINVFGHALAVHDVLLQLAVITAVVVGPAWAARLERLPVVRLRGAFALLALAALAGGRLHFLLNSPATYRNHPLAALALWGGPFHVPGALIAMVAVLPAVCRLCRLPVGKVADGGVVVVATSLALARAGCFLQGCCFGRPCSHAWCLRFPPGSEAFLAHVQAGRIPPGATASLPVHPLQLYFLAACVLVLLGTLVLRRYKRFDGEVTLAALAVMAGTSFGLELLRSNDMVRVYWGPLPQLAWTNLAIALVCCAVWLAIGLRERGRDGARPDQNLGPVQGASPQTSVT